jgi:hypothetical protein
MYEALYPYITEIGRTTYSLEIKDNGTKGDFVANHRWKADLRFAAHAQLIASDMGMAGNQSARRGNDCFAILKVCDEQRLGPAASFWQPALAIGWPQHVWSSG